MKVTEIKLSEVVKGITTKLQAAIAAKTTGVTYMYIAGEKVLSVSTESIKDDISEGKVATEEETTTKEEGK